MKLTKTHKLYLALLGLAGAALVIDRVFLSSGPDGAVPAAASAAPLAPAPALVPVAAAASGQSGVLSLAHRLDKLAPVEEAEFAQAPEAFALPKSWQAVAPASAAPPPVSAETFAQSHRLTSICLLGGGGSVTVGDKVLALEQEIDGFRLVSVQPRSAVFQRGDERVELKLGPVAP